MNGEDRARAIQGVLIWVMVWNFLLCVGKVVLGLATGLLNVFADGIHSIGDTASNLVGLAANKYASKIEDEKYPYGYGKFEMVGALFIVCLIVCGTLKIFWDAVCKLFAKPEVVSVDTLVLVFIGVSIVCNIFISRWENKKGALLKSQILVADAAETKSDVWVSVSVFVGLSLMKLHILAPTSRTDAWVTLLVVCFLVHLIGEAAKGPVSVLCDAQAEDPEKIRNVVMGVPEVRFCHAIRSHGSAAAYFLNLDIGVDPALPILYAHDVICHKVKIALRESFPGLKYACVHIEPDTPTTRKRGRSAFRERDSFDHSAE